MLLAGPYASPEELERFLREAEAVAGEVLAVPDCGRRAFDQLGKPLFLRSSKGARRRSRPSRCSKSKAK